MSHNNKNLSYAIVIPARYQSSRLPGKPLIELNGKTMIHHVWERCCLADEGGENVYIATDDLRIKEASEAFGANVIMTSKHCMTGTDRLAEANKVLKKDFIVNVQGDEPLIEPNNIKLMINEYIKSPENVLNAMCQIILEEEYKSLTIPKVVASKSNNLLYMSRAPIPHGKNYLFDKAMKQVCIYVFAQSHLELFANFTNKSPAENKEDIEILRFIENDIPVKMIEVEAGNIAIDVEADIEKVLCAMLKNST